MKLIWTNARALRNSATDAEIRLWRHLRSRQIGGLKFRRQFPIAGFIPDFACVEAKLVVELDGGQHVERTAEDIARSDRIEKNGYRVVRFWNDDVLLRTDAVLEVIWREATGEGNQLESNPSGPAGRSSAHELPLAVRHRASSPPTPPLQTGEGLQSDDP